jgi:hypothetical protein
VREAPMSQPLLIEHDDGLDRVTPIALAVSMRSTSISRARSATATHDSWC